MPKPLRADKRELRLAPIEDGNPTVDIFFDEHRVWSTKLPNPHPRTGVRRIPWPDVMIPHLHGVSTVTIRRSATGEDIASQEVRFGGPGRVAITDPRGRWLAIDKWNRFGPSFDGDSSGVQDRMLASAALVAEQLGNRGYPVYIVGGTLLGAMRSGDLLPHDDDIDFAFLCRKSDPQDVSLVSFELERQLASLGYTVVRHSHAHLEIVFFTNEGGTDYYIDIFTGYYSADGLYNQPFALRGELGQELLPTKPIEVQRGRPSGSGCSRGLAGVRVRSQWRCRIRRSGWTSRDRSAAVRELLRCVQSATRVLGEDLAAGRQARRGG